MCVIVPLQYGPENVSGLLTKLNKIAHRIVDANTITIYLVDNITRELYSSATEVRDRMPCAVCLPPH